MLNNLLELVRQNAGATILNNPAIPPERNEEVVREASASIAGSLQQAMGSHPKEVLGMLTSGTASAGHPVVQQATANLTGKLRERFNLGPDQASGIASGLVPMVLNQLAQKAADPNDKSFDAQGLVNELSGGKTGGMDLAGLLNRIKAGMDKDGDGDVDLQDLKSIFSSGGTALVDKVKGFFK